MKIMAALDLSEYADFVLVKAIKTAKQQNAKLDIVIVVEELTYESDSAESEQPNEKRFQDAIQAARAFQQKAITKGVKTKVRVLSCKSAAEEIIKYQKSENLDLIVLGRRSGTNQSNKPIGTVTEKVVANATCTVMVVRCMDEKDYIE